MAATKVVNLHQKNFKWKIARIINCAVARKVLDCLFVTAGTLISNIHNKISAA